jgi:hypothetical protein
MNRFSIAATAAVFGVAALVVPAAALAKVTSLKVSATDSADTASPRLPSGTKSVFVLFDYEGAANDRLTVALEGLGLDRIVAKSDTYNGNGSASVEITGAEIYGSLVVRVLTAASQAQSDVKRAADQDKGTRGYLEAVESDAAQVDRILQVLAQMVLPAPSEAMRKEVAEALNDLGGLIEEANDTDLDDAGRKAKAEAMKAPAASLVTAATALADSAESVSSIPLPLTGENAPITVQVGVGSSSNPSASDEFWVVEDVSSPITDVDPLPTAAATRNSGGTGGANPTARTSANKTPATGSETGASGSATSAAGGGPSNGTRNAATSASVRATSAANQAVFADSTNGTPGSPAVAGGSGQQSDAVATARALAGQNQNALGSPGDVSGGAMATWTVPAVAKADGETVPQVRQAGQDADRSSTGGSSGPNLGVLALGAALLVGVAVWLRSRM